MDKGLSFNRWQMNWIKLRNAFRNLEWNWYCYLLLPVKHICTLSSTYLPIAGELYSINPCVDIKVGQQQLSRLRRVQGTQRALTVVSEPGEGVEAAASILPLHLHQPLLIQSLDSSHWVVSLRVGDCTQGLLSTEMQRRPRARQRSLSSFGSTGYPQSPEGTHTRTPLRSQRGKTWKYTRPHFCFPQWEQVWALHLRKKKRVMHFLWFSLLIKVVLQLILSCRETLC